MKSPRDLGLPFDDWRPGQRRAIRTILGARQPHVVICAPTGSGKSTIALALPQMDDRRHLLATATLALQDQYSRTDPRVFDIRGMANYPCLAAKDEFKHYFKITRSRTVMCDDGPCHSGEKCSLKEYGCTYFDRYRAALASTSVLTNYSYLSAMRRYGNGLGVAQRVICDEAHRLGDELMKACGLEIPKHLLDATRVPRSHTRWRQWAEAAIDALAPGTDDDSRLRRDRTLRTLRALSEIDHTWAWDEQPDAFVFEPTVPRLLMPLIATSDPNTTIVYLSATITRSTIRTLGIDDDDVLFFEMPSFFPVERRPIYLVPSAHANYRSMRNPATVARWLSAIDRWVEPRTRLRRNGIIHSVSYARQRLLASSLTCVPRDRILAPEKQRLGAAVQYIKDNPDRGLILISPSVMTGYDFPDDAARWQVICKVPFPDTSSRIMKARIAATDGYRDELTAQTLMQACGRIVRSEWDWGETAIIDDDVRWFLDSAEHLLAPWFVESIVMSRRVTHPLTVKD